MLIIFFPCAAVGIATVVRQRFPSDVHDDIDLFPVPALLMTNVVFDGSTLSSTVVILLFNEIGEARIFPAFGKNGGFTWQTEFGGKTTLPGGKWFQLVLILPLRQTDVIRHFGIQGVVGNRPISDKSVHIRKTAGKRCLRAFRVSN